MSTDPRSTWRARGAGLGPRVAAALGVLWLAGAGGAGCGGDVAAGPASQEERYDAGMAALEADSFEDAEAHFRAMVDHDPADPIGRAGLARALAHQGRHGEAIVHDKLALAADPRLAEISYNIACSYARIGDTDEALRWLSRAHDGGIRDLNLIEQDPDLDALRSDHRFAFFLASGALSLSEREAHLAVEPAEVAPGQRVDLALVVVSLNRPLMATPERLEVALGSALDAGALVPVSRVERFEAGESGGREFFRRELRFGFRAREPLHALLGPVEVRLDDDELPVRPVWLTVRDVLPQLRAWSGDAVDAAEVPDAAAWFAAPSVVTEGVELPFARWETALRTADDGDGADGPEAAAGADGDIALVSDRDLVVGVSLETDGIAVPEALALRVGDGDCAVWAYPRTTAFLRTRAEGASRVWFQRRLAVEPAGPGQPPQGCPARLPVEVVLGDRVLFATEIDWP